MKEFGTSDSNDNLCLGLAPPRLDFGGVFFFLMRTVTAGPVYEERLRLGVCIAPLFPIDVRGGDFQTVPADHGMSLAKMQLPLRGCAHWGIIIFHVSSFVNL